MGNYVGQSDHENTAGCTAEYSCTASSVRTDTTPLPPPTDSSRPSSGIHWLPSARPRTDWASAKISSQNTPELSVEHRDIIILWMEWTDLLPTMYLLVALLIMTNNLYWPGKPWQEGCGCVVGCIWSIQILLTGRKGRCYRQTDRVPMPTFHFHRDGNVNRWRDDSNLCHNLAGLTSHTPPLTLLF